MTISSIREDPLTAIAAANWAMGSGTTKPFDPELVERIFKQELLEGACAQSRVVTLELSSYLELYLWPHFSAAIASFAHVMSIVLLLNEKFREGVPAWPVSLNFRRAWMLPWRHAICAQYVDCIFTCVLTHRYSPHARARTR